jgi:kynurenine formamidase
MKNVSTVFVSLLLMASVNAFAVDDRGNTATQGAATWLRAAQYMMPKPQYVHGHLMLVQPIKVEVSQLMDPAAPQSPFATPWSLTPNPTLFFGPNGVTADSSQAIFGHAANGEDICGEIGQQGTQMDALGHFGFINEPGDIEHILSAQKLAQRGIKAGDVVFIHTGYGATWENSPSTYYTQGPGLSHDAAVFLTAKKIVLVGLDNPFTDAAVNEPGVGPFPPMPSWENGNNPWLPFGVHHHDLTQAGVHQIQNLQLSDMAQKKLYLGAVFILPIRFKGGAGSPVRPVVIGHPHD